MPGRSSCKAIPLLDQDTPPKNGLLAISCKIGHKIDWWQSEIPDMLDYGIAGNISWLV